MGPGLRIFHRSLASAFLIAYVTEEDLPSVHTRAGNLFAGLLVIRIIWGFTGTHYARFSDFIYSPSTFIHFLKNTLALRAKRYLGHNPAGGAMIILMITSLLATTTSVILLLGVEELLARITALLHRSRQQPGGKLTAAGLSLDEEQQSVTSEDGQTHTLTGTEFRLLRYYLLNRGRVLSKSLLTEHVYNVDSDKDSNVIEVYVRRLRLLLGKNCIETRRGQGYVSRNGD